MDDYTLLATTLQDPKIFNSSKVFLDSHSWEDDWLQNVYRIYSGRCKKGGVKLQSAEDLYYVVENYYTSQNIPVKEEELDTYWELAKHCFQLELTSVVRDRVVDYLFDKKREYLTEKLASGLPFEDFEKELRHLKSIKNSTDFEWDQPFAKDQIANASDKIKQEEGEPITTGLPTLDKLFNGGWYRGKQAILIAKPGFGKTYLQIFFCLAAAKSGAKVGLVALDNTKGEMRKRIYHCATGLPFAEEISNSKFCKFLEAQNILPENFNILVGDRGITTWDSIEGKILDLAEQLNGLDMFDVDYLDVTGRNSRLASWEDIEEKYMRSAGLATKLKAVNLTASQPTSAAYNKKTMELNDFAGAVAKSRHCAYALAIRQSPQELAQERAWIDALKVREVMTNYSKPFKMERSTGQVIDIDEPVRFLGDSETPEEKKERTQTSIADRLKKSGYYARRMEEEECGSEEKESVGIVSPLKRNRK